MILKLERLAFSILGKRYMPVWVILIIDMSMVVGSFFFGCLLITNFNLVDFAATQRLMGLGLLVLCYGISFVLFRSYEGAFRHTGVRDLVRLFLASVSATVVAFLISRGIADFIGYDVENLSIAFLILHGFSFIMGVLGLRLFVKLAYSRFILKTSGHKENGALIYGAGITGISVLNAIRQDPRSNTKVVGFIDDNHALIGKRIDGIKVFSFKEAFEAEFLALHLVTRVVWSIQSRLKTSFHQVGEACLAHNLLFHRVPYVQDWIDGSLSSKQLRRVEIEDLLNRTPINLDNENVSNFLRGKKVLVTGAAGSIGSEIARQILHYAPEQLILVDNGETAMYELLMDFHRKMGELKELITFMGDVTRENRI